MSILHSPLSRPSAWGCLATAQFPHCMPRHGVAHLRQGSPCCGAGRQQRRQRRRLPAGAGRPRGRRAAGAHAAAAGGAVQHGKHHCFRCSCLVAQAGSSANDAGRRTLSRCCRCRCAAAWRKLQTAAWTAARRKLQCGTKAEVSRPPGCQAATATASRQLQLGRPT
jgi:hypothetical protein